MTSDEFALAVLAFAVGFLVVLPVGHRKTRRQRIAYGLLWGSILAGGQVARALFGGAREPIFSILSTVAVVAGILFIAGFWLRSAMRDRP